MNKNSDINAVVNYIPYGVLPAQAGIEREVRMNRSWFAKSAIKLMKRAICRLVLRISPVKPEQPNMAEL